MIEFPSVNPLASISKADHRKKSFLEIPYTLIHFPQVLKQKRSLQPQDAEEWLDIAHSALLGNPDQTIFKEGDDVIPNGYVGSGLTSICFLFTVKRNDEVADQEKKQEKFVLKIGGGKSFTIGYPDPSSETFAQWYLYNLNILRTVSKNRLPYFIPEPQEVIFANDQTNTARSKTLVIQPYYPDLLGSKSIYHLKPDEQLSLSKEFEQLQIIFKILDKECNLIPDFGQHDNITIARTSTGPHFVMIDDEVRERHTPAPILNLCNLGLEKFKMIEIETRLKRAIKASQKYLK